MSLRRIGILILTGASLAQSQTAPDPSLIFEVASIKPSGPQSVRGVQGGPGSSNPGRYRFDRVTLMDLIAIAFHVDYFQISSPITLDSHQFDLSAKLPEGSTRPQLRVMLQNLLAERFHLKAHIESREFAGYELVVAKGGPKLKEPAVSGSPLHASPAPRPHADDGWPDLAPNRPGIASTHRVSGGFIIVRTKAQEEPVSQLVSMLSPFEGMPIVDKTGLTAKYDFTLEYTRELSGAANGPVDAPTAPALTTALKEQLGLQLVPKKIPFDVVIVNSVDKMPTEN